MLSQDIEVKTTNSAVKQLPTQDTHLAFSFAPASPKKAQEEVKSSETDKKVQAEAVSKQTAQAVRI